MNNDIFETFFEYYNYLKYKECVEKRLGTGDSEEINALNAAIAAVYTINKLFKEDN